MKSKGTLVNNSENWSDVKRYKVNQLVSHNGSDWQNATGKNSEPGVGDDWVIITSGGTTPNLQQVTDGAGNNVTTNPISIPELNLYSTEDDDYCKIIYEEDGFKFKDINGEYFLYAQNGALVIRNIYNNTRLQISISGLTANRSLLFPDKNGTIAFLDDINDAIEGIKTKQPVRVATTAPISLISLQTIDGITVEENDRVLVKDHVSPYLNGIYLAKADFWERTSDANTASELVNAVVSVLEGTVNGNSTFRQTATTIILDTTNIVWVTFGTSVPDASSTTKGKAKLYNDLLGSNTDGGVTQSAVVTALSTLVEVSNDFLDDAAAAVGGIAVGGLYHTSGVVKIRLT